LFTAEEITRCKLSIATAVKPDEKIEAIRKMTLSKEPAQEKALLFLHALADTEWSVRLEAAQSLRQIGVVSGLVDSIMLLGKGDVSQKRQALHSLSLLFKDVNDFEKGVILQMLLTLLADPKNAEVAMYLGSLAAMIPYIPASPKAMLERIILVSISIAISRLDECTQPAMQIFKQISAKDPDLLTQVLLAEISKIESRRLRAFLCTQILDHGKNWDTASLAKQMVYEFGLGDDLDPIYLRLEASLVQLGIHAVPALLERFQHTIRMTERVQIIKLLDKIHADKKLPKDIQDQILSVYIQVFPKTPDALRLILLDNIFLSNPEISTDLQIEFATTAVMEIHKETFDQYPEAVKAALCRMKEPAITAILRLLQRPLPVLQLNHAAEILGYVALEISQKQILVQMYEFIQAQLTSKVPYAAGLFKTLGKIAASPGSDPDFADNVVEYLLASLHSSHLPYAVLEGLGWAVTTASTSLETKNDVCYLFMALLDKRLPENFFTEQDREQNKVFVFDAKSDAYTELLPILLQGMRRLGLAQSTSNALSKSISDFLLKKWQGIVKYKLIWGPKNTIDLAEILADFCQSPKIMESDQARLAKALLMKADILTLLELIANIFKKNPAPSLAEFAQEAAQKLIEFHTDPDYRNAEDQEIIMRIVKIMMYAKQLAPDPILSEKIREQLLYVLLDGLREQVFGIMEILKELLKNSYLNDTLKQEIQKRIPASVPFSVSQQTDLENEV